MQKKQIITFLKNNNIEFLQNECFKNYCTYGVGGKIKLLILPFNTNELLKVLEFLKNTNFFVLGAGSKILPSDKAFKTPVIKLCGEFEGFMLKKQVDGSLTLSAGAGVTVAKLLNYCKVNGLSGLEFLQGIPATIGGVVYMNASSYLGETKNVIALVESILFNGNTPIEKTFGVNECEFGYRKSIFQTNGAVITSVNFKVLKAEPTEVIKNCEHALELRSHHAKGKSCGSVFKKTGENAKSAGQLIDECGLKGLKYKKAKISEQHANFIINVGGAKSKHIKHLINKAHSTVLKKRGIDLQREVIYLEE